MSQRCAVHPARLAVDTCTVCGRPRCGVDARDHGQGGCAACADRRAGGAGGTARPLELAVRAGLAALWVTFVGGWIETQYVGTRWFSLLAPGLVGLAASAAATAAARRPTARWPELVAAAAGVLGAGLGFRLVPGGQSLLTPVGNVVPPYLAAAVGAYVWPVLFGPPRRRGQGD